jgi:hypothetical protein
MPVEVPGSSEGLGLTLPHSARTTEVMLLPWKPECRLLSRSLGLDLAALWRRVGNEVANEFPGRCCDLLYGTLERSLVGFGRNVEATELANELKRSVSDLEFSRRRLEVEQGLDVSAHRVNHLWRDLASAADWLANAAGVWLGRSPVRPNV